MEEQAFIKRDRIAAIKQARLILDQKPLYLDTETTGLDSAAEICDIAVLDYDGSVILSTLLQPRNLIPENVTAIYGITNEMVKDAPTFEHLWPFLFDLFHNRTIVTYNASFDSRMVKQAFERDWSGWDNFIFDWRCAMLTFARYYGEWDDYRHSYRWVKLDTAAKMAGVPEWTAHRAVGDALATQRVMQWLAAQEG